MSKESTINVRPGINVEEARDILQRADLEGLETILDAFFMDGQYYLLLNEYSFNTAMTLLNYATILYMTSNIDDRVIDMLVENLGVTVEPRDFARSVATYCGYDNASSAGIPTKILLAIRTGDFDGDDFETRLSDLPGDKFALMLGYIANGKRLRVVPHDIGKYIVREAYKRRLLPVEQLLPMIAMSMILPDESNGIGALLLAMADSGERHLAFSMDGDGKVTIGDDNVIPFTPSLKS